MKIKLSKKQIQKICKELEKSPAPAIVHLSESEMFALIDFVEEVPGSNNYSISLYPTGVGTVLIARDDTGREKDISDYDNW